jgi:non-ribosomal peptide synthase protein (TIGR01720 family)
MFSDPAAVAAPTSRALDPERDVHGTARSLTFRLPPEYTAPLLTTVPAAYHAEVNDVLLTALALAVVSWQRGRGSGGGTGVLVDLEGHGRQDVGEGLDLSRTVGWFTSLHPVRLDPGDTRWERGNAADLGLGRALKRVKEQLRAVPEHGIGYGMLRHLNPDTAPVLGALPAPWIGFNYLGRFPGSEGGEWQEAAESDALGPVADARLSMPHALELNAVTQDLTSGPQLVGSWTWPAELLDEDDVSELGQLWLAALRALVAHTALPGSGGLTPSDVRPAEVEQQELERLEADFADRGLADVLPLTPLQEGLLFHTLYDREAPDVYHVQLVIELDGPLDTRPLRAACRALVDRHPALRAAFRLTDSGTPLQLIARSVPVPWQEYDLGDDGLGAFLAEDRVRRFDPAQPPLLRFSLLRLGDDRQALVLTSHHILTDGWSTSLLLFDFFALWAHGGDDLGLPAPVPVRPYYAWLARQDTAAAEAAWKSALDGLTGPTLLAPGADTAALPSLPRRVTADLSAELTTALDAGARACGVTLNTVVQGAWALLLAGLTDQRDVLFGTTVSVRPPELPGVEEMVGLQISTVPVRVRLEPAQTLAALLTRIQADQAELAPHAHLGAAAVQRLAGLGPLYDTSTVFENFPRDAAQPAMPEGLRISGFSGRDAYHYPLKLMVAPGDRLHLEVSHRAELVSAEQAANVLRRLHELLDAFAADPHTRVGDLLDGAPDRRSDRPADSLAVPAEVVDGSAHQVHVLSALAAKVLGLERLDPGADFFACGGDSLRALRLAGLIGGVFGETPDVSVIFRHRTVAEIAARLSPSPDTAKS